jgi:hypothetical protein
LVISKKEESKHSVLVSTIASKLNCDDSEHLNTKSSVTKASLKARNKDPRLSIKNQIRSNLNLDYNKPCMFYKRPSAGALKRNAIVSPTRKRGESECINGDNLFLKHSKSSHEAKNSKSLTKHYVTSVPKGQS